MDHASHMPEDSHNDATVHMDPRSPDDPTVIDKSTEVVDPSIPRDIGPYKVNSMKDFYTLRHASEPEGGHDLRAAEYKGRLDALEASLDAS